MNTQNNNTQIKEKKKNESIDLIMSINSKYITQKIFSYLDNKKKLNMIIYSKKSQESLDINIEDFKKASGKCKIIDKNGKGKEFILDTDILIFEGEYLNKKRHGKGKEYNKDRKLIYEGEYQDGKKHGKGYKCEYNERGKLIYEGECLDGKRHGKGYMRDYKSDGTLLFEGECLNGIKHGKVKEYMNYGDLVFEGEYLYGERNGKAKTYYKLFHTIQFDGEYLNGKMNGKGKEYYPNGNLRYEGEYLKGKKNGEGKEYNENGVLIYEGKYLNGRKNGEGKEYNNKGKLINEGEFVDENLWNGIIKEYDFEEYLTCERVCINGKKNIINKNGEYYENEKLFYKGKIINGKKDGEGKDYYNDKIIFEGVYSKGRKITGKIYNYDGNFELEIKNGSGKIKKYYQNGKLKYEKEYLNGIIWNAKGYTQTGELDYEIIDGKGILKEYFEDGKLVSEIDYYNGEKSGNGKEYDYYKDLTLIKFEGQYFYDMRWNGTFKEYNNGELISEIEYFKGEVIPKSKNEDMDEYE